MSRPSSLFSHAVLGLAATTLLTTGCYKVGYKTGLPAGEVVPGSGAVQGANELRLARNAA